MRKTNGPFFKYVCPKCRSDEVGWDANAVWCIAAQAEELGGSFDNGWCRDCGDVDPVEVEISAEEYAQAVAAQLAADQHPAMIALRKLIASASAHDTAMGDDGQEGGAKPPTGDDYNDLLRMVALAAREAGLPALS